MEGLECKNWDEMSVTDTIFGRWERAADDAYIRNEIRSNIDVQTCNSYWYNFLAQGIAMNYCYPSTDSCTPLVY
jgi:hypothetical protein